MTNRRPVPTSAPPPRADRRFDWRTLALVAALVVLTLAVFAPVRHFDFVEIDDPLYVRENPHIAGGLTGDNVAWAFTHQHAAYWIPLTWLSYMADVELFGGIDAGGHHLTNLALHLGNVLLLFGLLKRATRAPVRSAFVAALFAVHPLHVESVAWITERKDVLSTAFWLLGLWAYLRYVDRPGWPRYAAIVGCLVMGLLAKPMLVTFPFVLLVMDVWPLGRVDLRRARTFDAWRRPVLEKLPLLALALAAAAVTYVAQASFGAAPSFETLPLGLRLQNAVASYVMYLRLTVWPSPLSVIYPLGSAIPIWTTAAAAAGLALVTLAVAWAGRARPYALTGWFWYLGTLVPVIGIVQVGVQARADRFMYVPSIGLFVMAVWLVADVVSTPRGKTALAVVGLVLVGAAGVQARRQAAYWQDSVTLWTHALETTLGMSDYEAHSALGRILAGKGRLEEARAHLEAALAVKPGAADVEGELVHVLEAQGQRRDALAHLKHIVQVRPDIPEARVELAGLLAADDQVEAAVAQYQEARRLAPGLAVENNIGVLLAQQGRFAEALGWFQEAARRGGDVETALVNAGLALANLGRAGDARAAFEQVLRQNPQNAKAKAALQELTGR
jgi:protein O-mannosyl-transferase